MHKKPRKIHEKRVDLIKELAEQALGIVNNKYPGTKITTTGLYDEFVRLSWSMIEEIRQHIGEQELLNCSKTTAVYFYLIGADRINPLFYIDNNGATDENKNTEILVEIKICFIFFIVGAFICESFEINNKDEIQMVLKNFENHYKLCKEPLTKHFKRLIKNNCDNFNYIDTKYRANLNDFMSIYVIIDLICQIFSGIYNKTNNQINNSNIANASDNDEIICPDFELQ